MNWESVSMPKCAHQLLDKAAVRPFSKVQGLAAILFWFAIMPLKTRIALIQEYCLAHAPPSLPTRTAPAGSHADSSGEPTEVATVSLDCHDISTMRSAPSAPTEAGSCHELTDEAVVRSTD